MRAPRAERRLEALRTPRLDLREMSLRDLDVVAALLADPLVMRHFPRPYTRAEAEAWIRRQQERYAEGGFGYRLAVDRATGAVVGQAGVLLVDVEGTEEAALGYIVERAWWRRGIATEAARACLDHAFHALGRARVVTLIRPRNVASQGVARKLGMALERRTRFAGWTHLLFSVARPAVTGGRAGSASSAAPPPATRPAPRSNGL
jgi:RimJ/RimL family protein N-acetyltransferase